MTTTTFDLTERQKGYARYLLKLSQSRRNDRLAAMKPALRQKMRGFMTEARAKDLENWDADLRGLYLRKLHRENSREFEAMMNALPEETATLYRKALRMH